MLKIYGVYQSRASRVYWMAGELGIAFEGVPVTQARRLGDPLAPEAPLNTHSADFLALSPYGEIPVIEDDGLVLSESIAINLYLARKHGGPLAAADMAEEGEILMWSLFGRLEAHLAASDYLVGNRFTVADLNVAEICRYAMSEKALVEAHPRVAAWYERCHDRPAFREMWRVRGLES
jgi:glutathione S-transferase